MPAPLQKAALARGARPPSKKKAGVAHSARKGRQLRVGLGRGRKGVGSAGGI